MMSHMVRPERVLELEPSQGTPPAEGLAKGGMVDTVDVNDELHAIQDTHWELLGITNRIRRHVGKALEVLESEGLFEEDARLFDVVFVDADKEYQRTYVNWAIHHVRDGGWIVVDNVLWWGEVLRVMDGSSEDPYAIRIHELNEYMKGHPDLDNVVLPLRDGLHVARKKPRA